MRGTRWLAACGAMALAIVMVSPAWAQGKGNGGGKKPPATTCDESTYDATVQFLNHPEYGQLPAIYAAGDAVNRGAPASVLLATTFVEGRVRDTVQNPLVDPSDPGSPLFPLRFDFSGGGSHYGDPDIDPTPHPLGVEQIEIDPRLTIMAYDAATLTLPECGMLGMTVGDLTSYVGRTGFLWYELNGVPAGYGGGSGDQQWILRHKPFDNAGNIPTHTKIVRVDANTWMLTSRTFEEGSDPAHFTSLQRESSGRGKNAVPRTFSSPIMPVQILLRVDCGGVDCAVPGGD